MTFDRRSHSHYVTVGSSVLSRLKANSFFQSVTIIAYIVVEYGGRNGIRFDGYHGQSVLVFEEFHSQIPIASMLNYLDIYPLNLPARYNDKVACYTTVYITSNIPLEAQYQDIQRCQMETWNAFLRRIHVVKEFRRGSIVREVPYEKI